MDRKNRKQYYQEKLHEARMLRKRADELFELERNNKEYTPLPEKIYGGFFVRLRLTKAFARTPKAEVLAGLIEEFKEKQWYPYAGEMPSPRTMTLDDWMKLKVGRWRHTHYPLREVWPEEYKKLPDYKKVWFKPSSRGFGRDKDGNPYSYIVALPKKSVYVEVYPCYYTHQQVPLGDAISEEKAIRHKLWDEGLYAKYLRHHKKSKWDRVIKQREIDKDRRDARREILKVLREDSSYEDSSQE